MVRGSKTRIKMTTAEHIEKLRTFMLRIYFTNIAHIRRLMQSKTNDHALYGHFLRDCFEAGLAKGCRPLHSPLGNKEQQIF